MIRIITNVIVVAFALLLVAEYIPGIEVDSLVTALIAAFILGILNALVRPVLVLLTFPITFLTLGLFIFVINAFIFWLTASFLDGFTINGFLPALIGSVIVSIISSLLNNKSESD